MSRIRPWGGLVETPEFRLLVRMWGPEPPPRAKKTRTRCRIVESGDQHHLTSVNRRAKRSCCTKAPGAAIHRSCHGRGGGRSILFRICGIRSCLGTGEAVLEPVWERKSSPIWSEGHRECLFLQEAGVISLRSAVPTTHAIETIERTTASFAFALIQDEGRYFAICHTKRVMIQVVGK